MREILIVRAARGSLRAPSRVTNPVPRAHATRNAAFDLSPEKNHRRAAKTREPSATAGRRRVGARDG